MEEVLGHRVPQIIRTDATLWALEMTIVRPPFVLDFASVYLDEAPEFPDEIMEEWAAQRAADFGDNWPHVVAVLAALRRHGLHMMDVHPGNITFDDAE